MQLSGFSAATLAAKRQQIVALDLAGLPDDALAEIAALGTLPDPWPARLAVLRVYALVCLEYSSTSDDPFSVKLPYYKTGEINDQLAWLLDMEDRIRLAIAPGRGYRARWIETVWDEDRIPGLRLFCSRFHVWGSEKLSR